MKNPRGSVISLLILYIVKVYLPKCMSVSIYIIALGIGSIETLETYTCRSTVVNVGRMLAGLICNWLALNSANLKSEYNI